MTGVALVSLICDVIKSEMPIKSDEIDYNVSQTTKSISL